jgi:hypothetical protein
MSSSADWSSMTRLYLKPLHPPGGFHKLLDLDTRVRGDGEVDFRL